MGAPYSKAPASGFDHFSRPQVIPVADQKVIGDLVNRVIGLPFPMNAPQQLDVAIGPRRCDGL